MKKTIKSDEKVTEEASLEIKLLGLGLSMVGQGSHNKISRIFYIVAALIVLGLLIISLGSASI